MKRITIVPGGWPCTLEECPPGFFMYEGMLGFKSEYGKLRGNEPETWISDAYCDSGETFCRPEDAIVQPVVYVTEDIDPG